MSIRCVCRNGHVLRVRESLAGRVGLCPACKTEVSVPRPKTACVSEDAILGILGESVPRHHRDTFDNVDALADTAPSGIHRHETPKKSCQRCNQEVSAESHICPYCHTYIANLSDF
jgi:hypothetical protein